MPTSTSYASAISTGMTVKVHLNHFEQQFRLVNDGQGDPKTGRLSVDSPLGSALLGRAQGETFYYHGPNKTVFEVSILEVSR